MMRNIPQNYTSSASRLCHLCRVTLRDSRVFRWTDHDIDLTRGDETYHAAPGMRVGVIEKSLSLAPDSASVEGVLSATAITEDELGAGAWDGATLELLMTDWSEDGAPVHVFTGVLGEVSRGALHFNAEVRGLESLLERPLGRVYSRLCDASVGDGRCGVDLENAAFKGVGVIAEIVSARGVRVSGISAFADAWFTDGRLHLGARIHAIETHRKESVLAHLTLREPIGGVNVGTGVTLYAGCARTSDMCRAKFANMLNFRGFPHMPGNDVAQAQAGANVRFDGGSRFR
jgi:uncharacterized phage protein (TIGR02218 family)